MFCKTNKLLLMAIIYLWTVKLIVVAANIDRYAISGLGGRRVLHRIVQQRFDDLSNELAHAATSSVDYPHICTLLAEEREQRGERL